MQDLATAEGCAVKRDLSSWVAGVGPAHLAGLIRSLSAIGVA